MVVRNWVLRCLPPCIPGLGSGLLVAATLAIAAVTSPLPGVGIDPAAAQSRVCKSLDTQLASLGSPRDSSRSRRRYAKAVRGQKKQIKTAQSRMRGLGCPAKKRFFRRDPHPTCAPLRRALSSMLVNLAKLEARASGRSGSSSRTERRRIQRARIRAGCDTSIAAKSAVDRIFGDKERRRRRNQAVGDRNELAALQGRGNSQTRNSALGSYGTVRTLCVRTCDGYYFPVSFSARKRSLEADAQACQNLCPGTEIKLYYHRAADETSNDMVSVSDGTPYTSLPNAYAFRRTFNANCTCNYRLARKMSFESKVNYRGLEELPAPLQSLTAPQKVSKTELRPSLPRVRPDYGADPETVANREGKLDERALGALSMRSKDTRVARERDIRIVGETFFPTQ